MTFEPKGSGRRVNRAWQMPRNYTEMVQRRKAMQAWARLSCGFMGRSPDHVASALVGQRMGIEVFRKHGEARAKALQKELRCLVCQGQSIDESNAPLATDLRRLIRQQIQSGLSDQQIKDFLVARYGVFVLMQPPVRIDTYLLWFGPILLLLVGGVVIAVTISRSRQRLAAEPAGEDLDVEA